MAHAALIAELVTVIERHARLPAMSIPQYPIRSDDDIDAIAAQLRGDWDLDDAPIDDVVREIERHGAVAEVQLANDVDAFSWPGEDRPILILGLDKGDGPVAL